MVSSPPMDLGPGWLRGPHYDLTLIGGVLLVALLSGAALPQNPDDELNKRVEKLDKKLH